MKKVAFNCLRMLILGAAVAAPNVSYGRVGKSNLNERSDLAAALHKIVCVDGKTPSPRTLWAEGVFDAQVEGRVSRDTPDFKGVARSMAAGRLHSGYAASKCEDGREIAASVPARDSIKVNSSGMLCIPSSMRNQCRGVSVDYASASGGVGNQLELKSECAGLKGLTAGLVSVTCLPKVPRWKGPEAFYYVPVLDGPDVEVPFKDLLVGSSEETRLLGHWINAIRVREKLLPLSFESPELMVAADRLAVGGSLNHDRGAIQNEKSVLNAHGIDFLGEDRVSGADLRDIAWLLYNSPRHRRLLLNSKGNLGSVVSKNHANGRFLLVVVGFKARINVSKSR